MVAYRHQAEAIARFSATKKRNINHLTFFEVKNASFSPSVSHISIFWLIMPRNFFGPVHNYMRLLIGAHLSKFLVKSIIPVTGSIVNRCWHKNECQACNLFKSRLDNCLWSNICPFNDTRPFSSSENPLGK